MHIMNESEMQSQQYKLGDKIEFISITNERETVLNGNNEDNVKDPLNINPPKDVPTLQNIKEEVPWDIIDLFMPSSDHEEPVEQFNITTFHARSKEEEIVNTEEHIESVSPEEVSEDNQCTTFRKDTILKSINRKCLKCQHCDFSTNWPMQLKRHLWMHHGDCVFKCNKCNFLTYKKKSMEVHRLKYLNYENCNLKKKISKKSKLDVMIDSVTQKTDNLNSSELDYDDQQSCESFNLKLKDYSNSSTKRSLLKCCHCDFKAYSQIKYQKHIKKHTKYNMDKGSSECYEDATNMIPENKLMEFNPEPSSSEICEEALKNKEATPNKISESNSGFINIISSDMEPNSEIFESNIDFDNQISKSKTMVKGSRDSDDKIHVNKNESLNMDSKNTEDNVTINKRTTSSIETNCHIKNKKFKNSMKAIKSQTLYCSLCEYATIFKSQMRKHKISHDNILQMNKLLGKKKVIVVLHDIKYSENIKYQESLREKIKISNKIIDDQTNSDRKYKEFFVFDFEGFEDTDSVDNVNKLFRYIEEHSRNMVKYDGNQDGIHVVEDQTVSAISCNNSKDDIKLEISEVQKDTNDKKTKIYSCSLCDFKSTWIKSLRRHNLRHSNNHFHKCKNCNYTTYKLQILQSHERKCTALQSHKNSPDHPDKNASVQTIIHESDKHKDYNLNNNVNIFFTKKSDHDFGKIKKGSLGPTKIRVHKLLNFPQELNKIAANDLTKLTKEKNVSVSLNFLGPIKKSPNLEVKRDSLLVDEEINRRGESKNISITTLEGNEVIPSCTQISPLINHHRCNEEKEILEKIDSNKDVKERYSEISINSISAKEVNKRNRKSINSVSINEFNKRYSGSSINIIKNIKEGYSKLPINNNVKNINDTNFDNCDKIWECKYCDHTTKNFNAHKSHLETAHSNLKRFKCKFCDYNSNVRKLIRKHYLRCHSSVIVERCNQLGGSITQEEVLNELCEQNRNVTNISLSMNHYKLQDNEHKNDVNLIKVDNTNAFTGIQNNDTLLSNALKRKISVDLPRSNIIKKQKLSESHQSDFKHLVNQSKIIEKHNEKYVFESLSKEKTADVLKKTPTTKENSPNHYKEIFKCQRCSFVAQNVSILRKHAINNCRARSFRCGKCSFTTNQIVLMAEHSSTHRGIECKEKSNHSPFEELENEENFVADKTCTPSRANENNEISATKTVNNKIKNNIDFDNVNGTQVNLEITSDLQSKKKIFTCSLCSFQSKYRASIPRHYKTHFKDAVTRAKDAIPTKKHSNIEYRQIEFADSKLEQLNNYERSKCEKIKELPNIEFSELDQEEESVSRECSELEPLNFVAVEYDSSENNDINIKKFPDQFEDSKPVIIDRSSSTKELGDEDQYNLSSIVESIARKKNSQTETFEVNSSITLQILHDKNANKDCLTQESQSMNIQTDSIKKSNTLKSTKENFECPYCSYKVKWLTCMKSHLKLVHKVHSFQAKTQKCPDCKYETQWRFNLKRHIQSHHKHLIDKINSICDRK